MRQGYRRFALMLMAMATAFTVGGLLGTAAFASFIGDTVTCSNPRLPCNPVTVTVLQSSREFGLGSETDLPNFIVDITSSTIELRVHPDLGGASGYMGDLTLSGLGVVMGDEIGGFSLDVFGQVEGFDPSDITFDAHSIQIHLNNTTWDQGSRALITLRTSGNNRLLISPPSGTFLASQRFDLALLVEAAPELAVVGGYAIFDDVDVTQALASCLQAGTLASGGQTLRCPDIVGSNLGVGVHSFRVILTLSDGSAVSADATWEVRRNSEP